MSDSTSDKTDRAFAEPDEHEPDEGDYTTGDHRTFFQYGRLAVVVDDGEEWAHTLKDHMDSEGFWPNVWFISDHGNAHLIDMYDELAEADEREGAR